MLLPLKSLRLALAALDPAAMEITRGDLDGLSLAIAALEKLALGSSGPLQVAVLGPTQAGKSTLVNLLCGREVTSVSALAGHTRHARGAAFGVSDEVLQQLAESLAPAVQVAGEHLDPDNLDQYSLADFPVPTNAASAVLASLAGATGTGCIVWDTPDFDSLAADTYRRAVLAIAGFADVIVLIASRDKYGDLAVWDALQSLQSLQRQNLFVINKVDPATEAELAEHISATQVERLGDQAYELLFIQHALDPQTVTAPAVLRRLAECLPVPAARLRAGVTAVVDQHWSAWTAPVQAEEDARAAWQATLARLAAQFMTTYRRDFLADAERYDTFQRLVAELLVLLEIPLLARTMGAVRRVVTWPVRQLFRSTEAGVDLGREPALLHDGCTHLLLQVHTTALQPEQAHPFWGRAAARLSDAKAVLTENFHGAAEEHQRQFNAAVEAAARALYGKLQEQPALLNSLRVARASADAAGVVVAFQTGGIGLADLVLTPVMLSLTTTLTETAAKSYVDQVVGDLQQQQYAAVQQLLDSALLTPLTELADNVAAEHFSGLRVADLEKARAAFEHAS